MNFLWINFQLKNEKKLQVYSKLERKNIPILRNVSQIFSKNSLATLSECNIHVQSPFLEKSLFLKKAFKFRIFLDFPKKTPGCQNCILRVQKNNFGKSCFFPLPWPSRGLTVTHAQYKNYKRTKILEKHSIFNVCSQKNHRNFPSPKICVNIW